MGFLAHLISITWKQRELLRDSEREKLRESVSTISEKIVGNPIMTINKMHQKQQRLKSTGGS